MPSHEEKMALDAARLRRWADEQRRGLSELPNGGRNASERSEYQARVRSIAVLELRARHLEEFVALLTLPIDTAARAG